MDLIRGRAMGSSHSRHRNLVVVLCVLLNVMVDSPATAPIPTRRYTAGGQEHRSTKAEATRTGPDQATLDQARKGRSKFKKPQELDFQNLNELRLTTGTFPSPQGPNISAPSQFPTPELQRPARRTDDPRPRVLLMERRAGSLDQGR